MERWRYVDQRGWYMVSDEGWVYNCKTNKFLKPVVQAGYHYVNLFGERVAVHRLVAQAFCDAPSPTREEYQKREVNHKNGNRLDNRACNLEWITHRENIVHAMKVLGKMHKYGYGVKCVETGIVYDTLTDAAKAVGCGHSNILCCIQGRTKTAKGYHWQYVNKRSISCQ